MNENVDDVSCRDISREGRRQVQRLRPDVGIARGCVTVCVIIVKPNERRRAVSALVFSARARGRRWTMAVAVAAAIVAAMVAAMVAKGCACSEIKAAAVRSGPTARDFCLLLDARSPDEAVFTSD
ncbi:hypothetical protein V1477_015689 [Vespula maculifrons]|uniref:Uncharacterized protein n=2 Tax=Vespula TaxID=7451 RepID=A0A834K1H6_VESVU|nr:hypothetical protein HZH66_006310 [Vespula vulgaris]